ncbi:gamma-DL-glutamyl hydrolase precursor [Desulfosporosinus acididurans]|uniref:Gamma-DL-glutamyl hydrolase n=1 Tax=Desulfosporosinus acididurans TaxID=476652 RepID=A0A0J1FLR6_9FIRM|nr:C40 family peptidase [Desulfosporosinus acididurans]KLU64410.1 gamma-DL-glutamyl hydrolase precursor [Desulfosporosinus acididurans]
MKKIFTLLVIVMCLLASPRSLLAATSGNSETKSVGTKTVGIVTASALNLRQTDVSTSKVLTAIPKNTQVDVISKNTSNWYNVKYNGQTGWVSGAYLILKTVTDTSSETTPSAISGNDKTISDTKTVGIVTASALNLRKTDAATSAVLTTIPKNAQVEVIAKNTGNWYNVSYNGQTGWVSGLYLTVKTVTDTDSVPEVSRSDSSKLVDDALSLLGVPYVFGGNSRSGFDCSGYTQYVFKGVGISLPRTAEEQYKSGVSVSREQLQAGDLVFFSTYAPGASHVGIYIGGGKFIAADSNKGICISNLDDPYYRSSYLGARRIS